MDNLLSLSLVFLPLSSFLPLRPAASIEESQSLEVLVESHPAGALLDHVLTVSLADLLALLCVEHRQFFLLDPFGIDLCPPGFALLVGGSNFNAFVLVVLFEGEGLGFFGFGLSRDFLSCLCCPCCLCDRCVLFGCFLDVLVLVELVLDISDVAPSSSFLSGLVAV